MKAKKMVVPDQSLSLQEILLRFTRNEQLPIGKDVQFHESDDDLEKVSKMDLVDRAEYVDKLKETQKGFEKQERKKAADIKKRAEEKVLEEARQKLEKGGEPPK